MAKRKKKIYCTTVFMDGGLSTVLTTDKRTEDKEQIYFWYDGHIVGKFYLSKLIGYKDIDITEENEDGQTDD